MVCRLSVCNFTRNGIQVDNFTASLSQSSKHFFVYKTTGFIHVADIVFIDRSSYFAERKPLVFCESARTIRQDIYKSLVGFCLSKLHLEFQDLYEHCKVKPSSYATAKIWSIIL